MRIYRFSDDEKTRVLMSVLTDDFGNELVIRTAAYATVPNDQYEVVVIDRNTFLEVTCMDLREGD
ncbi:hypothetical protein BN2476_350264 [Paraburkholderia piptadeniae]|uniref:Uncharacterized protein n=1 Tax=Paraburkholderia piptadeniae TaxID=1701573 RepID=A0A1N7S8N5_9BURK|nr:hypothetical protein [Paraburkholderia piptadeniae]SIT43735.1 hypothetical protein BN2476_350264 [Paraburkholderia piptadeniae]